MAEIVQGLLARLLERLAVQPFTVRFWDGSARHFGEGEPVFCVHFRTLAAALESLATFDLGFGNAYMNGDIEIEGDLVACLSLPHSARARELGVPMLNQAALRLLAVKNRNSLLGSRKNIAHHYDIDGAFYKLWLDPARQYTCAYFTDPAQTIEQAQRQKMELVCRKLRLQPGQKLLEVGCGWGGFAMHAARHHGVEVTSYNISREQIEYARAEAARAGLVDRVTFILDDYRAAHGRFDAFASIGMLEHVGPSHYRDLCGVIARTLAPGGHGLLHFIGRNAPRPFNAWLTTHIFPGAYAPALEQLLPVMAADELETIDVHNLRLHYQRTLECWLAAFEQQLDTIRTMFDERFIRMWRFYLAGSIAAFASGSVQLYQVLFTHGTTRELALDRRHHELEPAEGSRWPVWTD